GLKKGGGTRGCGEPAIQAACAPGPRFLAETLCRFFCCRKPPSLGACAQVWSKDCGPWRGAGGGGRVEVDAMVRPSLDLEEMLSQDLELEREAMQAYLEAWTLAEDDVALRRMLEDHIETEQPIIEELEMLHHTLQ